MARQRPSAVILRFRTQFCGIFYAEMNTELARQRLHLVMLRNETSLDISGFRCAFISNEVNGGVTGARSPRGVPGHTPDSPRSACPGASPRQSVPSPD